MSTFLTRPIALSVIAVCLLVQISVAQAPFVGPAVQVPTTPSELWVPAGNTVFMRGHAIGTQNYICLASGANVAWRFLSPQATLFFEVGGKSPMIQQMATHFLSPNPIESGLPRPTWQSSTDTSAVWGQAIATSTDPNFVAPGSIPWLLLLVVGAQESPSRNSMFAPTTFIHRLNTVQGVSPTTGCSTTTDIGKVAFVPYEADYFFYRAN